MVPANSHVQEQQSINYGKIEQSQTIFSSFGIELIVEFELY